MKKIFCFECLYFRHISSSILFIGGLLTAPALILQSNLLIKVFQTSGFLLLNLVLGKKLMISGASLFFVSTVVMSLFTPLGRVLYHAGPLLITEDALNEGLQKGLNMAGLLYLSRFSVRAELRLPGKFGQLISRMFFYLHYLIEERKKIKLGSLTSTLDALFIRVGERSFKDFTIAEVHSQETTPGGLLFILLTVSFNWVLLF